MKEELVYYKPKCVDGAATKKIGERGVFFVKEECEKAFPGCETIELKNGDVDLPEFLDIDEIQVADLSTAEAFAGFTGATINTILDDSLSAEEQEFPHVKNLYIMAVMKLSELPTRGEVLKKAEDITGEISDEIEKEIDNTFAKIKRRDKKTKHGKEKYVSLLFLG